MTRASSDGEGLRLLTLSAAARTLGVDRSTLRKWVKLGRLHPVEVPTGGRYISTQELERFIEERTIR